MNLDLTNNQRDALTEIFNIAIGRAADSLNQMVKEEIILSIPEINFYSQDKAFSIYSDLFEAPVGAVRQRFESTFSGDALLVFPERQSLYLVKHVLGDLVDDSSIEVLEHETMSEVGNVVLNGCLSSLADQLGTIINSMLPEYTIEPLQSIFETGKSASSGSDYILFVKVDFRTHKSQINGYIMLIVDIVSAKAFLHEVEAYIERVYGE